MMSKIISIHSYRRGSGKTSTAVNLGVLMALQGMRVAVVDANLQSPSLHILLGLDERHISYRLNDYLAGRIDILTATFDATALLGITGEGEFFAVPASPEPRDIAYLLRHGYDLDLLHAGMRALAETLKLEVLIIDNPAGLLEDNLSLIAIADKTLIVMRYDSREFQGTSVLVGVARKLDGANVTLLVNEMPAGISAQEVIPLMSEKFACPVIGVIPHLDEMFISDEKRLFVLREPSHPVTKTLKEAANQLIRT